MRTHAGICAAMALCMIACGSSQLAVDADDTAEACSLAVDTSLAEYLLNTRQKGQTPNEQLTEHPALFAITSHQHLSGNARATAGNMLERMQKAVASAKAPPTALDYWRPRQTTLVDFAKYARDYLPDNAKQCGKIFIVAGYDIGAAAPPDIILNVAHPHFVAQPKELGFYATHEAHHVGFMSLRGPPALTNLNEPSRLISIIEYMTQLEGLGVHAAYNLRKTRDALGDDPDYAVYEKPAVATSVISEYKHWLNRLASTDTLSDEMVGNALNALSSGDRLWYRFGALVAWKLEKDQGRTALITSINQPEIFRETATQLMKIEWDAAPSQDE